ncbi:hypothetical protein J2Z79_001359 [Symbiobacterium terraclitae]|uniref:Small CPxCG-related zinc finger protein n=1 Tax=Symbiobacterium terraclitae TaxID=557451 RepID=A0ABS4JR13_9FIRM|nr:hypothetical protein [Symbiobacterium terraclitae]MBP2017973.1 hypothetical protein [Symbiobacterium terraclitae]
MSQQQVCAWCGSAFVAEPEGRTSLCPDCHEVDETESAGPLHPAGERQPYHE